MALWAAATIRAPAASRAPAPTSKFAESVARSGTHSVSEQTSQLRSEEHTSELQSLMRISYAVFCLKKKTTTVTTRKHFYKTQTQYITKQIKNPFSHYHILYN